VYTSFKLNNIRLKFGGVNLNFIKTSFYKEKIDLRPGAIIAGYGGRISKGVHDDLFVRTMLFQSGEEVYVLIQLDLLAIDYYFSDFIKVIVSKKFNIKTSNIIINCSHTHSGVGGVVNTAEETNRRYRKTFGEFDEEIANEIIYRISNCIDKAINSFEEFTIYYGNKFVEGICTDRNNPDNTIKNQLQVLYIKTKGGKNAVIYNYACHPTVMEGKNLYITADFPGETSRFLEENNIEIGMFYNGDCGNISTRFTKTEASFSEVERIGFELGKNILDAVENSKEIAITEFKMSSKEIELNIKEIGTEESVQRDIERVNLKIQDSINKNLDNNKIKPLYYELEGAKRNLDIIDIFKYVDTIKLKVTIFNFGDIYMVYIPGELFSKLGDMIRYIYEDKKIFIVGYSNGYIGYIPDRKAYEEGCFETMLTPLAKNEGEKLIDNIVNMIHQM
jgi:hypothetical protein